MAPEDGRILSRIVEFDSDQYPDPYYHGRFDEEIGDDEQIRNGNHLQRERTISTVSSISSAEGSGSYTTTRADYYNTSGFAISSPTPSEGSGFFPNSQFSRGLSAAPAPSNPYTYTPFPRKYSNSSIPESPNTYRPPESPNVYRPPTISPSPSNLYRAPESTPSISSPLYNRSLSPLPNTPQQLRPFPAGPDASSSTSRPTSRLDASSTYITSNTYVPPSSSDPTSPSLTNLSPSSSTSRFPSTQNTDISRFTLYQSTCNCEGFYTVFTPSTAAGGGGPPDLAFYSTVNVITLSDIAKNKKLAAKAKKAAQKASTPSSSSGGGFSLFRRKSVAPSAPTPVPGQQGGDIDWSSIDLLLRSANNEPLSHVRLGPTSSSRIELDMLPDRAPWSLYQEGVVTPIWEISESGRSNDFQWKRIGDGKRTGDMRLVHKPSGEVVAEFVANRVKKEEKLKGKGKVVITVMQGDESLGRPMGRLVVKKIVAEFPGGMTGESEREGAWITCVVGSLLAILEKQRRTRLEWSTKVDPNW